MSEDLEERVEDLEDRVAELEALLEDSVDATVNHDDRDEVFDREEVDR